MIIRQKEIFFCFQSKKICDFQVLLYFCLVNNRIRFKENFSFKNFFVLYIIGY